MTTWGKRQYFRERAAAWALQEWEEALSPTELAAFRALAKGEDADFLQHVANPAGAMYQAINAFQSALLEMEHDDRCRAANDEARNIVAASFAERRKKNMPPRPPADTGNASTSLSAGPPASH